MNSLKAIESILNAYGIRYTYTDLDGNNSKYNDEQYLQIYQNIHYGDFFINLSNHNDDYTVFFLNDDLGLNYLVFTLPKSIQKKYHLLHLNLGAFRYLPITKEEITDIMIKNKLSDNKYLDYLAFYQSILLLSPEEQNNIIYIISKLLDVPFHLVYVYNDSLSTSDSKFDYNANITFDTINNKYHAESQLQEYISLGDYSNALYTYKEKIEDTIINKPLKRKQSDLISLNTLGRMVASNKQINPVYIESLSSSFISQIENLENNLKYETLVKDILEGYCFLINDHSLNQYSDLIKNCVSYIEFNFTNKITLSSISQTFHISKYYLSTLFKKEVGENITVYIHKLRIDKAIKLLKSTHHSIETISELCGYDDKNYFIKWFKKLVNETPNQYRKMMNGR